MMEFRLYLKLAWRNIWRNRKRTWITASSIGFAVFFACVMQSMQLGQYSSMITNAVKFYTGHLGIHQKDYWEDKVLENTFETPKDLLSSLNTEEIEVYVPRLSSFALASFGSKTKGTAVNGIVPELEDQLTELRAKVVAGTYNDGGIMVSEGLASYLKLTVGDTLVLIGQGFRGVNAAGKYPVTTILRFPMLELNQSTVYLPLENAQYLYGAEGRLTSISLLLEDADDLTSMKEQVTNVTKDPELAVMTWREMMPEMVQTLELDYYGGLVMIYILYAVIGFGIFGTFLMMTNERMHEFGILVSVGMKKLKIQVMVAFEILMLTLFGVLLGISASLPLLVYFNANPIPVTGKTAETFAKFGLEPAIPFSLDPGIFYHQGIVILIIALFLGIYPLITIQRLTVITALKE